MKVLKAVAAEQFKKEFMYTFQRDQSKPPTVAGDATFNIGSDENICSVKNEKADEIPRYVDSVLLRYI